MGNSDGTYESWRKNAVRQVADDRFTVLFHEMVEAYFVFSVDHYPFEHGVYTGLRTAYVLLTGDAVEAVDRQVRNTVDRMTSRTVGM